MRNLLLATAAFLALALPGFANAQAPACRGLQASGNPQYPPYLWRNPADADQLIGSNQALMQWLSKEIGLPIEVRYVGPWSRVQEEARSGRIDLIAGAFFTLPRTEYMDYVYPPVSRNTLRGACS
jgi:polar amino acid transport system substrate-binding protein